MTLATRNEVIQAVFSRISSQTFVDPGDVMTATTWVTKSRRLKLFSDVPPAAQPAMYVVEHNEQYNGRNRSTPRRGELTGSVFCYARTDGEQIGGAIINVMMDAVEAAFAPDNGDGACTLGGIVSWAYIDGQVFKDPGDIDNQAMLIVPFRVMIP